MDTAKKTIMDFFPLALGKYLVAGAKFVFFEMWIALFLVTKAKIKDGISYYNSHIDDSEFMYEAIRGKQKEAKPQKINATKMKELEQQQAALVQDLKGAGALRTAEPHTFQFRALNPQGKLITGSIKGTSKVDINTFLVSEGYKVFSIETSKQIEFVYGKVFAPRLKTKELIFWLTQLTTYLRAGITLNEGVRILTTQMRTNKAVENAFKSLSYELSIGESFSEAMKKQGDMFPPLLINMIKAAEASGTLEETLEDMSNYYTELNDTKKAMVSAITYPALISVFAIGVSVFICVYVVPQFRGIYDGNGMEIGGLTKVVFDASDFLKAQWFYIIAIIGVIVGIFVSLYKYIKGFKVMVQMGLMRLPLFKNIIIYNELTIFSKTFASLLKNNVYITESVDILSKITSNEVYKAILFKTINNIIKGDKISEAFRNHWAVPDIAYYMIVTGESTGQLATMMAKVSDYYSKEHKAIVGNLKTFLEPVIIVFLTIIVGIIVLAILVPMFEMYNQVNM